VTTIPAESKQAVLRREFAQEAAAGFPHLLRIPATHVAQFIDYFGSLDEASRNELLEGLSARAACLSVGEAALPSAAVENLHALARGPGPFVGGWRYTDIRFLASVPRLPQFGSVANWLRMFQGPALSPRPDLLPDMAAFVPAKAALLRKLIKTVLAARGFTATAFGGGVRFLSADGVLVDCDFGARMGQLRWEAATGAATPTQPRAELSFFSYEGLWSLRSDWDYLTEENAERCLAALPELIAEAIRLGT